MRRLALLGKLAVAACLFGPATATFGQEQCVEPPAGLVSWWTGDVDATDRSGSNDGVLTNGATAGALGMVDGAFALDGVDDRIITTDPNVSLPNLTVAAWINPDDVSSHHQRIVTKFNATGSTAGIWVFDVFTNGRLRYAFGDSTNTVTQTWAGAGTVTSGTWQFVAASYDGVTIRIYHNAVLVKTAVVNKGPLDAFSQKIVIGEDDPVNVPEGFDGLIDEVTLFDRALDQIELQGMFDAGAAGMCKCLPSEELCDGIDNDCDGIDDEGYIEIHAAAHTVGSGSHPGSTKDPLVGIEVCAYDKAAGSCSRITCGGISHQHYQCIVDSCTPTDCCTTDEFGECTIEASPGDYIVISDDATKTVLPDPLGVSASDLLCGEVKQKHLQQIVKADGKKVSARTTRRTGSELLIIEPEFVVWDGTEQLYPFVFEAVGDWGVTAAVAPPEGFVSDYDSLATDVTSEIECVQFTITEVGSDLVPTGTTFTVTHKGRREIIHSQIGILLTPDYARSRGFHVNTLRAAGLLKELPDRTQGGERGRRK